MQLQKRSLILILIVTLWASLAKADGYQSGWQFTMTNCPDYNVFSTTSTFTVQVTVTSSCVINSASTLNFGSQGVLTAAVDNTSTVQVQCTNTTPYNIGLDAGAGSGATVAARKMTNGSATVTYSLYTDAGRTTVWGNTIGTDTVAATGNESNSRHRETI